MTCRSTGRLVDDVSLFHPTFILTVKGIAVNAVDYVLLAVLGAFLIYGYMKGFLRQVLLFIGIGVSFFLASRYHVALAESNFLESLRESNETVALVVCFVGILFVSAAITSIVASLIGRSFRTATGAGGDRWLGALLGVGVGAVLLGGVAVGIREWKAPDGALGIPSAEAGEAGGFSDLVAQSLLLPHFADVCLFVVDKIPKEQREELIAVYDDHIKVMKTTKPAVESSTGNPVSDFTNSLTAAPRESASKIAIAAKNERTNGKLLDLGALRTLVRNQEEEAAPAPASAKLEEEGEKAATDATAAAKDAATGAATEVGK